MLLTELLLLLLFYSLAGSERILESQLEPGHLKPDYDTVEEVRGHQNDTEEEKPTEDEHLTREAILDVAYYLRRFKFSGHDPRYLAEGEIPKRNLFVEFPSPPLRNIHWEVKKNCQPSFVECLTYLQEQVTQTVLPRHLDSLTVTKQNGWSFITDKDLIKAADDECLRLLDEDEKTFNVFPGPLQRFQWLTSASYYMCLYTMKENPYLKNFTDDCDNFGSCIQWEFGLNNKDFRGNNNQPFACAFYSFCPDPCCPLRHVTEEKYCWGLGPCQKMLSDNSTCLFSRKENTNLESLTMNRWNVSCHCDEPGTRWESKSGLCVDINECTELKNPCHATKETCINLPGKYKCECSPLGYKENPNTEACEEDPILQRVLYPTVSDAKNETKSGKYYTYFQRFFRKVKSLLAIPFSSLEMDSDKNSYAETVTFSNITVF